MGIELRCEGCGKQLRAPREKGGKRSKCPACGHEVYIPTPEDEIEELPFAPENAADLQREADLQADRRRVDRMLAHDQERGGRGPSGRVSSSQPASGAGGRDIQATVLAHLVALRDSDLVRVDESLSQLRRQRSEAIRVVDQLAANQLPPAQMSDVPPAVYQGFLKNLRSQL